jgi:hypothetical protein
MFGDPVKAVVGVSQGDRSRSVDDPAIRVEIAEIVARLVE